MEYAQVVAQMELVIFSYLPTILKKVLDIFIIVILKKY